MTVMCLVVLRPSHDQVKEKQIQTRGNFPEKNKVEKEILAKQKNLNRQQIDNISWDLIKKETSLKKQNKVAYNFFSKPFNKQWQSFS